MNIEPYIDEIARRTAVYLFELQNSNDELWISQNKAWKRFGGRAYVTRLLAQGKVKVRQEGNQNQYFQPDLVRYSKPKKIRL